MPISYPPSFDVSDSPSKAPTERFFSGGGVSVSCAYPLDATPAQVSSFGFDGKLTVTGDDEQDAAYTVQSALVSGERWAAFNSDPLATGSVAVPASGVAIAINVPSIPEMSGEGDSAIQVGLWFEDSNSPGGSPEFAASIVTLDLGGFRIGSGISASTNSTTVASAPKQICAYLQQTETPAGGSALGMSVVYSDDTTEDLGLTGDTFAGRDLSPLLVIFESSGLSAGKAGTSVPVTFVSSASEITAPVPAGAVDICGNTI